MITIDDFLKCELRVATILDCERVEGSEKLLKWTADLGEGEPRRTVVSGIAKKYAPEDLVGKQVIIVANLEPRAIMGIESQGMILAVNDAEGMPIVISPSSTALNGAKVK